MGESFDAQHVVSLVSLQMDLLGSADETLG
jgi:hypothetical protein